MVIAVEINVLNVNVILQTGTVGLRPYYTAAMLMLGLYSDVK